MTEPHVTKQFKPIDWKIVDSLLIAGCEGVEIAANLGIRQDTLYDATVRQKGMSWTEYSTEKRKKGDSLLRTKQFEKAMKGDTTMMVWLGKNRLKQRDKFPEEQAENKGDRLVEALEALVGIRKQNAVDAQKASTEPHNCPTTNDRDQDDQSTIDDGKTTSVQ